jgi:hypothetical protein
MSSKPLLFLAPTPARSPHFKNPSETVPPTDELEVLQTELLLLREKSWERAKKAGEDLKTIEESMRRIKEREKGKAKAVEKVKRERGCTCLCPMMLIRVLAHDVVHVTSATHPSVVKIQKNPVHASDDKFLHDLAPPFGLMDFVP